MIRIIRSSSISLFILLILLLTLSCYDSDTQNITSASEQRNEQCDDHINRLAITTVQPKFYRIGLPFALFQNLPGYFTAVTSADLNRDGKADLLFSGGRHTLKGKGWIILQDAASNGKPPVFKKSYSFGVSGGYTGIGVAGSIDMNPDSFTLLLAGGSCHYCSSTNCYNGDKNCSSNQTTPAVLFSGYFNSSSLIANKIWEEPYPGGNRTGTLAELGNSHDPVILLAGEDGFDYYERNDSLFDKKYHLDSPGSEGRYAGISYKKNISAITQLFIALGARASNPSVIGLGFGESLETNPHVMNVQLSSGEKFEVAGVAVDNLTGLNTLDVIVANGADSVAQYPFIYSYPILSDGSLGPVKSFTIGDIKVNGRVVITGKFFIDSTLPDIAIGTTTGDIILYANVSSGSSIIFERRTTLRLRTSKSGMEIRGLSLLPAENGFNAIAAAIYNPGISSSGQKCKVISTPKPEAATNYLSSWPCYNAFIIYPDI